MGPCRSCCSALCFQFVLQQQIIIYIIWSAVHSLATLVSAQTLVTNQYVLLRLTASLFLNAICGNLVPLVSGAPPDFRGRLCLILRFKL